MARLRIAVRKSEARQAREADAAAVKNGSFVPTSRGLKLLHQETRDQV
jgi:hypothetical protein